ncbi:hypothetical protein JW898_02560 [Candidatus Woesearchaeota archaeon]|nr:hypothetical protein [Candidatus Woesearchaeota archaeon]
MNRKWKKMNVFERIEAIRQILKPVTKDTPDKELVGLVLQVQSFREGKHKELNETQRAIYDLLMKHELSPKTVYCWLLLERAPSHVKEKLKARKVSIKDGMTMSYEWRRMMNTKAGKDIMAEMMAVIGGLKWRGQENL